MRHSHLQEGYRERFRALLGRVQPRRLEFGVELLMGRARERSAREGVPLPRALADLYEHTRVRVDKRVALMTACALGPGPERTADPRRVRFVCDASLGGLARWLRAAGYQARWVSDRSPERLAAELSGSEETFLTSNSVVLRRRDARDGTLRLLWVPTSLGRVEQLALVLRDLGLAPREPLCMACGGALAPVRKADVAGRIPPRTARWKDDYFVCASCGRLFWQGTHWERILPRLRGAAPA